MILIALVNGKCFLVNAIVFFSIMPNFVAFFSCNASKKRSFYLLGVHVSTTPFFVTCFINKPIGLIF